MVRVLISTGEVSGDLQGSLLVAALHRQAALRGLPLEVLALGGARMEAAGADLLADTAPLGSIGLWEALPLVLPTLKLQARVNRELASRPPDAVVLSITWVPTFGWANACVVSCLRCQSPITSPLRNGLGA